MSFELKNSWKVATAVALKLAASTPLPRTLPPVNGVLGEPASAPALTCQLQLLQWGLYTLWAPLLLPGVDLPAQVVNCNITMFGACSH